MTGIRRIGVSTGLAMTLALGTSAPSSASTPSADARYRASHGGKVALEYFAEERSFVGFDSRKADHLEPNLAWVDHRKPTDGGQVDIAFTGPGHRRRKVIRLGRYEERMPSIMRRRGAR
jgi:hypothetical protein